MNDDPLAPMMTYEEREAAGHFDDGTGLRAVVAPVAIRPSDRGEDVPHRSDLPSPDRFFSRDGLLAQTAGDAVLEFGPLAMGIDGKLWAYEDGVYRPGEDEVRRRFVALFAERVRHTHYTNVHLQLTSRGLPEISCGPIEEFINFANGLLDWRAGRLLEHDPAVLSTVQLPGRYRPGATCPATEAWMATVLPADCLGSFIWELIGYLMLSGNPLHKAVMFDGTGRNGKGTMLRLIEMVLGTINVASVPLQSLSDNRFAAADLFGKVANIAGDLDARRVDDTSIFKMITGADMIRAERKYGQPFSFTCWAVPVFSANKIPASADPSEGYLRRWLVVPFPNRLTDTDIAGFDERALHTTAELEGVVARSIEGLRRLMERGRFDYPPSVLAAADSFAAEVDHVRSYLADRCVAAPEEWTPRTALFENYKEWGLDEGRDHLLTASAFYDRLAGIGYRPAVRRGTRGYAGISTKDAP